jgi:hypothetical protein
MVLRTIVTDKAGEILGYICETPERGSFFMQRKRVLRGSAQNMGLNGGQRELEKLMRNNRMQGV